MSSPAPMMKLSQFARENNIKYPTAHRLWKKGEIEGIQLSTHTILVSGWKKVPAFEKPNAEKNAIIYARVSNMDKQQYLNGQIARLEKLAADKGYTVIDVVEEVGSGYSNERSLLREVLRRKDWDVLLVEHREIPVKFGFDYLQSALSTADRTIECRIMLPGSPEVVLASSITNFRNFVHKVLYLQGLHKRALLEKLDRIED